MIGVPILVFWQTTSFEFVWDDELVHLARNPYLSRLSNLLELWKTPYSGLYIPVAYTLWGLLKSVGQLFSSEPNAFNPFVYHIANLFLHIANGFLLFALLRLLSKNKWAIVGGVLLFLVHPVQVEAVSWASEFRGLLSVCFGLSALILYLQARLKERSHAKGFGLRYGGGLILFTLAILSKPSAISVLLFAAILDKYLIKQSIRTTAIRILPWLLAVVPTALVTISVQTSLTEAVRIPIWERPLIWMDAITFYFYKIINPVSLTPCYGRTPAVVQSQWWFYVAWIPPVTLGVTLFLVKRSAPLLGLSFLLFIVGFLPVSGLITFDFQKFSTVADRYIYLSMTGISLSFVYGLSQLRSKRMWIVPGTCLMAWVVLSAIYQIPVWKNSFTLWNHCISINRSAMAHNNRGSLFGELKQYGKALRDYDTAIDINPYSALSYYNRGVVFSELKKYGKALRDYDMAININPKYADAYFGRGVVFSELKKYGKALRDYDMAININQHNADAYYSRGTVFAGLKQYEKALKDYDTAIGINPQDAGAHNNRGTVFAGLKQYGKALRDYDTAIDINPKYTKAYYNRGNVFSNLKQYGKALRDYDMAIDLNPQYGDARRKKTKIDRLLKGQSEVTDPGYK